jgi:uncharacterized phage infection (PIP) family protein YhgE
MRNLIYDRFKGLQQSRFSRIAIAVTASFILFLGTACSPSSPSVSGTGSYQEGRPTQTELYKPNQAEKGGMNRYSDTDARQGTAGLSAEAKARIDEAKGNLKQSSNQRQFANEVKEADPLKKGPRDISKRAGNTLEDLKEDISEGTQRGIKNLKANTQQAKEGVKDTVGDARQNVEQLSKDASRGAQKTANELKGNLDDARRDVSAKVSDKVGNVGSKLRQDNDDLGALQSGRQRTPDLDAGDLAKRAKDSFGTASGSVGDFATE